MLLEQAPDTKNQIRVNYCLFHKNVGYDQGNDVSLTASWFEDGVDRLLIFTDCWTVSPEPRVGRKNVTWDGVDKPLCSLIHYPEKVTASHDGTDNMKWCWANIHKCRIVAFSLDVTDSDTALLAYLVPIELEVAFQKTPGYDVGKCGQYELFCKSFQQSLVRVVNNVAKIIFYSYVELGFDAIMPKPLTITSRTHPGELLQRVLSCSCDEWETEREIVLAFVCFGNDSVRSAECDGRKCGTVVVDSFYTNNLDYPNQFAPICSWSSGALSFTTCTAAMISTRLAGLTNGGIVVIGATVTLSQCTFQQNGKTPTDADFPSLQRNIVSSGGESVTVSSAPGGDGVDPDSHFWISEGDCAVTLPNPQSNTPFVTPTLSDDVYSANDTHLTPSTPTPTDPTPDPPPTDPTDPPSPPVDPVDPKDPAEGGLKFPMWLIGMIVGALVAAVAVVVVVFVVRRNSRWKRWRAIRWTLEGMESVEKSSD
ncbi:hypothetical protein BLNAU_9343 [Blattamonas nauphoetae]|uniref:receptor protein-tyrosine kinase n=1 Tax=Blattamonas nauphoetae TaxID=2049346 RepID=A0ABQ9XVZ1_9EUKA|nr:hypothetical protein BLNAU_9343 [Blattamonas nauphoetae]